LSLHSHIFMQYRMYLCRFIIKYPLISLCWIRGNDLEILVYNVWHGNSYQNMTFSSLWVSTSRLYVNYLFCFRFLLLFTSCWTIVLSNISGIFVYSLYNILRYVVTWILNCMVCFFPHPKKRECCWYFKHFEKWCKEVKMDSTELNKLLHDYCCSLSL
jgi:hypothetical protein